MTLYVLIERDERKRMSTEVTARCEGARMAASEERGRAAAASGK
jgi:hypothetical protein